MEPNNTSLQKSRHSLDSALVDKNDSRLSWRPSSFANITSDHLKKSEPVLDSVAGKVVNHNNNIANNKTPEPSTEPVPTTPEVTPKHEKPKAEPAPVPTIAPPPTPTPSMKKDKTIRNTVVDVVIVEAKGLPDPPQDSHSHTVYCKFRLGSQSYKSKSVTTTKQPQWRERFSLHLRNDQLLHISLRDKGKRKNFMGSCVLDLSTRERERTHDIWQDLEDGYGSVHLSVTLCAIRNSAGDPSQAVTIPEPNVDDLRSKYAFYNLTPDTSVVGQLHVKVIGARGLSGKPNAYCTLELDNERVQTPSVSSSAEPMWNKSYVFNIYDVASTFELKVYDRSINSLLYDFLGRVIIPLLRINSGEACWYALKDSCKKKGARGNCPRVRLEMNIFWNPVIASLKLFRPKQVKYIAKPPKFDIPLIYKNCKFIKETFEALFLINEHFKSFLEWEDRELSTTILISWLIFWYYFDPWMTPLLVAALFPVMWFIDHKQNVPMHRFPDALKFPEQLKAWVNLVGGKLETSSDFEYYKKKRICDIHFCDRHRNRNKRLSPLAIPTLHLPDQDIKLQNEEDPKDWGPTDDVQNGESVSDKIKGLPEMTLIITDGIEYMVSLAERVYNLATFKVPFLTVLSMLLLTINSALLFFVPCKYLMMGFGLYKYGRKRLDPERVLNNDILDFISRVPDNKMLRYWKELSVPEPQNHRNSMRPTFTKSVST